MMEQLIVPVPNGRLHVERGGEGPPVVLLHSGLTSAGMWDPQLDALAAEHTVIRYDARSHGRSSTAHADYRNDEDLLVVLDHLGIGSASLVGNSMGGATAASFALEHPDRVDRLVLAGAGVPGLQFRDEFLLGEYRRMDAAKEAMDADAFVEAFLRFGVDGPHRQPSEVDPSVREKCRVLAKETVLAHHTATGTGQAPDVLANLERIEAATLVLMGELELSDLWRFAREAQRRMPNARLESVAGCGHMVNLERPELFNALVLEHLAS